MSAATSRTFDNFDTGLKHPYVATIAVILVVVILRGVYNVFLHPLSAVPGPFLAGLTRWWLFWKEMQGNPHHYFHELHKVHGPLLRIAPNEVSVSNPEVYKQIYGQTSKFLKAHYYYHAFENHAPNLFTLVDKTQHSQDKRLLSNAFSRAAVLKNEATMYDKVAALMDRIGTRVTNDEPVPLFPALRCLTLETISQFAFGETIGVDAKHVFDSPLFEAFDLSAPSVVFFQHFPFLRQLLRWISNWELPFIPNGFRGMEKGAEDGLSKLRSTKGDGGMEPDTMFSNMISAAKRSGIELRDVHLVSEGVLMLFAGTDTTAATLAVGIWNLCQRRDMYRRLQKELKEAIPNLDSRPSISELEKLPILNACMKENLRLTCPVRGRLPRIVPTEGFKVGDVYLKPGTIVAGSPYYECYDEEIFPQPEKYKPERWLVPDTSELESRLHPFSRGQRQCIGQNLSLVEQRLAFSQFVRRFNPVSLVGPEPHFTEYTTLAIDSPLNVKLAFAE